MASGVISMGVDGYLEGQIVWSSSSNGSTANSSAVTGSIQIRRTNSYTTTGTWTGNLNIGGDDQSYSYYGGISNSWVTIKSFSITKGHNDDGTGSCYIYGKVIAPTGTSMAGKVLTAEQTVTLDTIPRYASITAFSLSAQTLCTATFKWNTNVNCSKIEYKVGSGSYVNANQTGTGNTFKITGLSPSTNYKVKLRVTRSDSGLTTESSEVSVTTLAIATITSASDFNIGTSPTIKFTNPSGNVIQVYMEMDSSNTNISNGAYTVTGRTEYQFTNVNASAIYASIPSANSKSFRYVIKTTEGSNNYYSTVTKTAYVVNSNPTLGSFTYKDNNSTVSGITGNNQRIVRNQSTLLFTIGSATAKNSATISKYQVTFNGTTREITSAGTINFGTVNLSYSQSATLKVIDSRGNSTSKSINITIDEWIAPTGIITLRRKNNYEAETYLTVDGSYSSVNSKNTMTIKYQYKKTTASSYNTETTISDNTQKTLSLDNQYAWDFKITITDKFTTTTYTMTLNIGMPIIFIDANTQKIGINMFPTSSGKKVQISGGISTDGGMNVTGGASIGGGLNATGGASINGDTTITGSETVSGNLQVNGQGIFPYGVRGQTLNGGSGTNGYMYICDIKTTTTYQNQIIKFDVLQRNRVGYVWICLTSSGTAGAVTVNSIKKEGNINVYYKCASNVLSIYIQKQEAYDSIEICNIEKGSYMANTSITWKNTTVTSLPSGYVTVADYMIDKIYPVGSIYMSVNSTSPATLFGGTWSQLQNRFLLGAGSSYSNGATGGESTHKLTESEMPSHVHTLTGLSIETNNKTSNHLTMQADGNLVIYNNNNQAPWASGTGNGGSSNKYGWTIGRTSDATNVSSKGSSSAHNNMPPYLVVYMWKRTA